ncbi:MAG TPA: GUN4 domain-containing protein [Allocoleopsis sp.]
MKLITNKANFTQLDQLLAAKNWKDADQETTKLMLKIAAREKNNYLRVEDCRNFPREELRIIDQLWLQYSQNKFGFSVQKEIWLKHSEKLDGIEQWDIYVKLAEEVGWKKGDKWLNYDELSFDILSKKGHIPSCFDCVYLGWDLWILGEGYSFLFSNL